jgi:hypothetical protein
VEKPAITIRRFGGYVVVITVLLFASVMCTWWVLSGQLAVQRNDSTNLVN